MIRIIAPSHIRGPVGEIVAVPYVVLGAEEVLVDPMDPAEPPWAAATLGVIRCCVTSDAYVLRLEASADDAWRRHSIVIEAWDFPWLKVEAAAYPKFRDGLPQLPRLTGAPASRGRASGFMPADAWLQMCRARSVEFNASSLVVHAGANA